jgi:hypothetical protein
MGASATAAAAPNKIDLSVIIFSFVELLLLPQASRLILHLF